MDIQKLTFLIRYIESDIPEAIERVLHDSLTDPHYSAVHTTSLIRLCMEFERDQLKRELPYSTVKEYFLFNAFTEEEYEVFEAKRAEESAYYIGEQY